MRRNWGINALTLAIFIVFGGASIGLAAVPPPPVNQNLAMPDVQLNALEEADCRVCHSTGVPDRHHLLYGTAIPEGHCADQDATVCQDDSECQTDTCDLGTGFCVAQTDLECAVDQDCQNDYCILDSQAPNASAPPSGNYECLTCHTLVWNPVTSAYEFESFRDCLECHFTEFQPDHPDRTQEPTVHHRTVTASVDLHCMACHGSFVNNFDDGHTIPTYDPSIVTPWPSEKGGECDTDTGFCEAQPAVACTVDADCSLSGPNGEGNCNFCHDAGIEGSLAILDMHDAHHETGLTGITLSSPPFDGTRGCYLCHPGSGPNHDAFDIRNCERCHGIASLHNIQADSNGGGIDPGNEDVYYGHIGNNDDCFGCHGFTAPASAAPYSGPVIPHVQSADLSVMTAGDGAVATLTGAAFTNLAEGVELTSNAVLTATDGSGISLDPASVSESEMVVDLPGTLEAGNYRLRAAKADKVSNPVVVSVKPEVTISEVSCNGGTATISGSGFGGYVDATDSGTGVTSVIDGAAETGTVVSWSDSEIVADFSACGDSVEVSSVFGTASTADVVPGQNWAAASIVGVGSKPTSDIGNYLYLLIVPFGALLLLKRRCRRK